MTIDDVKERWEKITSGPWFKDYDWTIEIKAPDCRTEIDIKIAEVSRGREEDATAIANAPTDIAFLLAEVELLREKVEDLNRQYEREPDEKT